MTYNNQVEVQCWMLHYHCDQPETRNIHSAKTSCIITRRHFRRNLHRASSSLEIISWRAVQSDRSDHRAARCRRLINRLSNQNILVDHNFALQSDDQLSMMQPLISQQQQQGKVFYSRHKNKHPSKAEARIGRIELAPSRELLVALARFFSWVFLTHSHKNYCITGSKKKRANSTGLLCELSRSGSCIRRVER